MVSQINDIKKSLDPHYAVLSQQLSSIQKNIESEGFSGKNKQTLAAELMNINRIIAYDYLTAVKSYVGGNVTPQTAQTMAPGSQGVPSFPSAGPGAAPEEPAPLPASMLQGAGPNGLPAL